MIVAGRKTRIPLTAEQQVLVEKNIPLAYYFAKRMSAPKGMSREDWEAECLFALVICAGSYDPSRGKFATLMNWTVRSVRQRIYKYCDRSSRAGKTVSLSGVEKFIGRRVEVDTDLLHEDAQAKCDELLRRMPARHAAVIRRRMAGETLTSIADSMGLTRERVRQIECEGMRRMVRVDRIENARRASG